ncbi:uncharacterized protein LAESUDRAFT_190179 [Laetiporus sulphureus 93-53]|uniref:Uncharacterized protein n=1 Tax=Laetiporus sulphureus 93-53 TaxID=1314785 RepID=A0A165E6C5_9APHY|nr:uncharacterized protein LAESUDRAFT_190179 [Laetiporus sulphureus 93-53]KZT06320.1 hypothetical protein LAESUDRAFT_190179 [Laetiporus sulphureus 93-53]
MITVVLADGSSRETEPRIPGYSRYWPAALTFLLGIALWSLMCITTPRHHMHTLNSLRTIPFAVITRTFPWRHSKNVFMSQYLFEQHLGVDTLNSSYYRACWGSLVRLNFIGGDLDQDVQARQRKLQAEDASVSGSTSVPRRLFVLCHATAAERLRDHTVVRLSAFRYTPGCHQLYLNLYNVSIFHPRGPSHPESSP